jgi:hypothetical protein
LVSVANTNRHNQIKGKGFFMLPIITGTIKSKERFVHFANNNRHNQIKGNDLFMLPIIPGKIKSKRKVCLCCQ